MFEENEISKNAFGGTEIAKRKLAKTIDLNLLTGTQIICSRIRELDPNAIRIFWGHDLPQDPESQKLKDENYRNQFHQFVFVSNWQYEQYRTILGFPYSDNCTVIESGFDPIPVDWAAKTANGPIRFCYTSTPQRGLNLLVPVFDALSKQFSDIHLDVYSSFKIYGWDEADKQFEPLYEQIRNHPNMSYHGFVDNETLKSYLTTAHIHAYPCTWIETSCRAMLEGMSGGLQCIHPNLGALPDTSGSLNFMYQGDQDPTKHAQIFYNQLVAAYHRQKNHSTELYQYLKFVKNYTDHRYNMNKIKFQWEDMLRNLHEKYPEGKRGLPEQMFVYRS